MRKMACLVLIAFSSRPSPAFAQIDFSTLKVKLGQTVYVTTGGTTRVALDDPNDHSPAIGAAAGGAVGAVIPFRTRRILDQSPDC